MTPEGTLAIEGHRVSLLALGSKLWPSLSKAPFSEPQHGVFGLVHRWLPPGATRMGLSEWFQVVSSASIYHEYIINLCIYIYISIPVVLYMTFFRFHTSCAVWIHVWSPIDLSALRTALAWLDRCSRSSITSFFQAKTVQKTIMIHKCISYHMLMLMLMLLMLMMMMMMMMMMIIYDHMIVFIYQRPNESFWSCGDGRVSTMALSRSLARFWPSRPWGGYGWFMRPDGHRHTSWVFPAIVLIYLKIEIDKTIVYWLLIEILYTIIETHSFIYWKS